jgi:mRNA interferase RelE/StbE
MAYAVKWRPKTLEELRKLPKDEAKRILHRLELAVENPHHYLERLVGDEGYKLRVGDYRVIIDIVEEEKVLAIRVLGHRSTIYKRQL